MSKVLVKRVEGDLEEVVVGEDSASMYEVVSGSIGGWIEHVQLRIDGTVVDVWLDEEGKLKSLPVNLGIPGDVLVGTLVFTGGADEVGRTLGVSEDIERAVRRLYEAPNQVRIDWP